MKIVKLNKYYYTQSTSGKECSEYICYILYICVNICFTYTRLTKDFLGIIILLRDIYIPLLFKYKTIL